MSNLVVPIVNCIASIDVATILWYGMSFENVINNLYMCNLVYCIHVPGHDPITFSFRSFSFLIGWGFYGPVI